MRSYLRYDESYDNEQQPNKELIALVKASDITASTHTNNYYHANY